MGGVAQGQRELGEEDGGGRGLSLHTGRLTGGKGRVGTVAALRRVGWKENGLHFTQNSFPIRNGSPWYTGLDLVTATKGNDEGGLRPLWSVSAASPGSSGSGLITLMVGTRPPPPVTASAPASEPSESLPVTFLRLRSRLPALVATVGAERPPPPEARVLGGKWNDLGVLSGVLGREPPASKLKSALETERFRSFSVSAALVSIRLLNLSSSAWQSGDTSSGVRGVLGLRYSAPESHSLH